MINFQYEIITKGYTLTEPVAVPMANIRRAGSQAMAVGLFGNPCCTVWNKIKRYYGHHH